MTQPMGGAAEPDTPQAKVVDAPDPPPEAEITASPGILAQMTGVRILS